MSQEQPLPSERLVQVYQARDEWQGNLLIGYLRDSGIEAVLRLPPSVPPTDLLESGSRNTAVDGIFVLERDAEHAGELVRDFVSSQTDEALVEEAAAHPPPLTKNHIAELRDGLVEERKTFALLGWLLVAFVVAVAVLWATMPAWIRYAPRSFRPHYDRLTGPR